MGLAIFRVTARFLIPRAGKRVHSQMMRTHPEPIDDTRSVLITESYGHLPDCRHWIAVWNSCHESVYPELAKPRVMVYVLATSLKACSAERLAPHGAEGSGAARRRSRWGRGVRDRDVQPRRHRLRDRPECR